MFIVILTANLRIILELTNKVTEKFVTLPNKTMSARLLPALKCQGGRG